MIGQITFSEYLTFQSNGLEFLKRQIRAQFVQQYVGRKS